MRCGALQNAVDGLVIVGLFIEVTSLSPRVADRSAFVIDLLFTCL